MQLRVRTTKPGLGDGLAPDLELLFIGAVNYRPNQLGLEWFIEQELCDAEIVVKGDSMLVINQMFGSWKIKSGLYAPLAEKACELLSQFTNSRGEWIPRDRNDVADRLSKEALKRAGVKLRLQPA